MKKKNHFIVSIFRYAEVRLLGLIVFVCFPLAGSEIKEKYIFIRLEIW